MAFDPAQFRRLIESVNSHFSRVKDSSLTPLLDFTEKRRIGQMFMARERSTVQELIFNVPYDKQKKYATALDYLSKECGGVVVCGRPTNPVMKLAHFGVGHFRYAVGQQIVDMPVGSFHHVFTLSWKSSTGNLESLRNVGTREAVTFRNSPAGPPFNYVQASIPMSFVQGTPDGAHFGHCDDDHSNKHPSLICASPRVAGEVIAEQWYEYTIDRGTTWTRIPTAAYLITRGVRSSGGKLVFFFRKTHWPQHNPKPFHFEAEYAIGPQPQPMPAQGVKLSMQTGNKADISKYALRVIAKG